MQRDFFLRARQGEIMSANLSSSPLPLRPAPRTFGLRG
jgi:hypothetical protein